MKVENSIGRVRPAVSFEAYKPETPEQEHVLILMKDLTGQLASGAERITSEESPFSNPMWIMLHGKPGTGKTHLIEAMVNELRINAPGVLARTHLSRDNFTYANMTSANDYGGKPILIIDDLFSDVDSVNALSTGAISALKNFVMDSYEKNRLIVSTCNFPMKDGILPRIKAADPVGRITSRLAELLSYSGELEVKGPDHRLMHKPQGGGFRLFE